MSYEKLNLSNGTVLDQNHLAHIEDGISQAQARTNIGVAAGDDKILYLTSPNGTKFAISVSDNDTLSAAQVT